MLRALAEILSSNCLSFCLNLLAYFTCLLIGQCVRDVEQEIQISSTSSRFEVSLNSPFLIVLYINNSGTEIWLLIATQISNANASPEMEKNILVVG